MKELPKNVTYGGNTKTKSGKIVSKWDVEVKGSAEFKEYLEKLK